MKRFFITFFVIIVCFLLQTTIFQRLALADEVPNLLLIITVSVGYMRGRTEGMFTGFFCGLLVDMYGDVLGLHALLYMIIGYCVGICNMIYYKDDYTLPIMLVGVSDFFYNFFFYVFSFLLRGRLNFLYYLRRIMLPELVYTVLVSILLYKLLHTLNGILEKKESMEV